MSAEEKTTLIRKLRHAASAAVRPALDLLVASVAVFTLVNLAASVANRKFDSSWLWTSINSRFPSAGWFLLLLFASGVLVRRRLPVRLQVAARVIAALVGIACLAGAVSYYKLLFAGVISSSFPIPLSLILSAAFLAWAILPTAAKQPKNFVKAFAVRFALGVIVAGLCLLAQLGTYGSTDYRRPADAIVVFGAGVNPDGRPSDVLRFRMNTACQLYKEGMAPRLILSGGRNPAVPISEPEAMRRFALDLDIPYEAIILDEAGVNTIATLENVKALAGEHGWNSFLMVSNDYHLSRISLISHRLGLAAYTVPAREKYTLRAKPWYVQRELAAWLYYYLRYPRS